MKIPEKSQYTIYIDAAERDDRRVILFQVENNDHRSGRKEISSKTGKIDLVNSIALLLEENNLKLADISKFESNLGPGSFTGLKISVTITNVLNWIMGKKKISELDVPDYGREPNISEPKKFKL